MFKHLETDETEYYDLFENKPMNYYLIKALLRELQNIFLFEFDLIMFINNIAYNEDVDE